MLWRGFATQDTRAPPSTGFRPPFGPRRVTLERPKVTKGLLPRLFARLTSGTFGSSSCPTARADGPLASAIHGFAQSPLRTSVFSRQIGSSCARPFPILPMAQRHSLGVLPRGLDKRARLSEQEGDQHRANPQPPSDPQTSSLSPWKRVGVRGMSAFSVEQRGT